MNRRGSHPNDWLFGSKGPNLRVLHVLVLLFLVSHGHAATRRKLLDEVVAGDIFPPSSSLCSKKHQQNTTTSSSSSFSFDFTPSDSSHWSFVNKQSEHFVFEVEMRQNYSTTAKNSSTTNITNTIRIGKGGNIYSFVSSLFGEAIPPQSVRDAPWMDEVHQMVSVNSALNNKGHDPHPYFIHQAGTYMRDKRFTPPPFYSPTLAIHCDVGSCIVVSWGQQAHIPTSFSSPALYYTKYQDCGAGVLEVTQIIHNMVLDGVTPSSLTYLNVPWTGIRTSNLPEMLHSNPQGTLVRKFPIQKFGRDRDKPTLIHTGGFTTFSQEINTIPSDLPLPVPCTDVRHTHEMDCRITKPKAVPIAPFQLPHNHTCRFVAGLSRTYATYMVRLTLEEWERIENIPGCGSSCGGRPSSSQEGLLFTNTRSNFTIQVQNVLHWRYHHKFMFFSSNVTAVVFNQEFRAGDIITVSFAEAAGSGRSSKSRGNQKEGDNKSSSFAKVGALTFVHGKDEDYTNPENTWFHASTRMRYGLVPEPRRDMTVYTINVRATILPGETYVNRQFILTGALDEMEQKALEYVDETFQDMWTDKDSSGSSGTPQRKVSIYANSGHDDNSTKSPRFGVIVDDHPNAISVSSRSEKTFICSGFTTPQSGHRPLFYITCSNSSVTYVGMNPYALAPTPNNSTSEKASPLRPYVCKGKPPDIRPRWKLLGYFRKGSCDPVQTFTFDPDFCKRKISVQGQKE